MQRRERLCVRIEVMKGIFVFLFIFAVTALGVLTFYSNNPREWSDEKLERCEQYVTKVDEDNYSWSYGNRIKAVINGCF